MMPDFGNLDYDDKWNEAPMEAYLSKKRREDISDIRYDYIYSNLRESPSSKNWKAWDECVNWRDELTVDDAWEYLNQLQDSGNMDSTVEQQMAVVSDFLSELMQKSEVIDSNPVAFVKHETDFESSDNSKIERSIDAVGEYLRSIKDFQMRAIGVSLSKTGFRKGECLNIDLPFIHIDDPIYEEVLDTHGIDLHENIKEKPDSIYIPSEPRVGDVFRGEQREAGNKRKVDTYIPIDEELKQALLDWLAVRPITTHPHPLWTSPAGKPDRLAKANVNQILVNRWGVKTGFVDSKDDFNPHWFRHFFTTNMQSGRGHHDDSVDLSLVKYIRGDVQGDITDIYTHEWGNQVKEQFTDSIYHFGIYD